MIREGELGMVDRREVSKSGTRGWQFVPLLFVALAVVVVAQSTRLLFPIMFEIGEDWDFVLAGLVALGAFSSPVLVAAMPRLSARASVIAGSGLMTTALLSARLFDPIPAQVAIAVAVAALVGVTLLIARGELGAMLTPSNAVVAVVVGLAIDVGVRAAFGSWDLAWQSGVGSLLVTFALVLPLLAFAWARGARRHAGSAGPIALSVWVAGGGYFLLQLLFLQNFGFVASQGQVSVAVAVFWVLAADAVAIAVVSRGPQLTRAQAGVVAVAVVAVTWVVPLATGIGAVAAVVALQPALSLLLARAVTWVVDRRHTGRSVAMAVGGGSLLYSVLVLLWSLHIDQPLPVPRQTVPAFAALILAVVSLRGAHREKEISDSGGRASVAIVLGLMAVTPVWLLSGVPNSEGEVPARDTIRLVSYNVRGSVGIDGQLAPDRIVDEILSSDPDVVVIQEAARGWPIHGTMDLVSYLQRELEMDFVYVAAADGQFGNAVFSRYPMNEIDRGFLPSDGSQERAWLLLQYDAAGTPVYIAGTHLHPRSTIQVKALLEAVRGFAPLVVAGDMNIAPEDPEIDLFADAGLIDVVGATGDECRTTSAEPTSDCDRPDWVFVTPDLGIDEVRIGSGGASDHLAIHVTLRTRVTP
jgi:endonuclease/exonuclease/phosphatase family metal-dependent hydrolase